MRIHVRRINPMVFGDDDTVRKIMEGEVTRTWRCIQVQPPEWAERAGVSRFTSPGHVSFRGRADHGGKTIHLEVVRPLPWLVGDVIPLRESVAGDRGTELIYRADHYAPPGGVLFTSPMYAPRWTWRTGLSVVRIGAIRVFEETERLTPEQARQMGWPGNVDLLWWVENCWNSTPLRIERAPFRTNPWAWDVRFIATKLKREDAA